MRVCIRVLMRVTCNNNKKQNKHAKRAHGRKLRRHARHFTNKQDPIPRPLPMGIGYNNDETCAHCIGGGRVVERRTFIARRRRDPNHKQQRAAPPAGYQRPHTASKVLCVRVCVEDACKNDQRPKQITCALTCECIFFNVVFVVLLS